MKKMLVVGAGIAGASISRIANDSKKFKVTLIERHTSSGGLIGCSREEGVLFHRTGGHVFNTKNENVLNWFTKYFNLDRDFIKANREAKIYMNDRKIGYPIENNLYELDDELLKSVILDYLNNSVIKGSDKNFFEFIYNNFGPTLAENYFIPYNKKIWQYPLDKIALPWLAGKLPMPNFSESMFNSIRRLEESNMVHSRFYYPKSGGSQFIIDTLLKGIHLELGTELNDFEVTEDSKIVVEGVKYDCMVYTGPILEICNKMKLLIDNDLFPFHGTTTLLCETQPVKESWTYFPDPLVEPHRIIYTGNFSPTNNSSKYPNTCTVEISGKVEKERFQSIIDKLPGIRRIISYNYTENSYVIQNDKTREEVNRVKDLLKDKNIYLLGRFAEWEYYNMDAVIESSLKLFESLKQC